MNIIKTTLFAAIAAMSVSQVSASPETDEMCDSLAEMSYNIMFARQNGASISIIRSAIKANTENTFVLDLAIKLTTIAYQQPAYGTKEYRERAAMDFANEAAVACYSNFD